MSSTATTETSAKAVNYDAHTGDVIAVRLKGWPSPAYFYVATTTPNRVVLRELKHVTQKTPGRFVGIYSYETLRALGAEYAEGTR